MVGGGDRQRRLLGAGLAAVLGASGVVWWLGREVVLPAALAASHAGSEPGVEVDAERAPVAAADSRGSDPGKAVRSDVAAPDPGTPVDEPQIAAWVRDLRDDEVPWNAASALGRLVALPRGAVPALERALLSSDVQQRHLVALALRQRCRGGRDAPSPRLFEVTVEALAGWMGEQLAVRRVSQTWSPTAEGTRFLAPNALAAREPLRRGLGSGDEQQRFLCAWLLGQSGDMEQASGICRELLPHLGDNQICGDALMAANGIYRLGTAALPTLRWWRPHVDAQARGLIDLIVLDLEQPPRSRADVVARGRDLHVTQLYHDPALEFDVTRSPVPSWGPR